MHSFGILTRFMLIHKFYPPFENQLHPFINAVECVSTALNFRMAHRQQPHSFRSLRQIGVELIYLLSATIAN